MTGHLKCKPQHLSETGRQCHAVRNSVTCLDLVFRDAAKLDADKVESPSSSSFSRCVALEYSRLIFPFRQLASFLKSVKLLCLSVKRQHVLAWTAIVLFYDSFGVLCGCLRSSWRKFHCSKTYPKEEEDRIRGGVTSANSAAVQTQVLMHTG